MRIGSDGYRTSNSARDCPVCGHVVPWSRYWLRSWSWAEWPCPNCGTILGFARARRRLMLIPAGLAGGLFSLAQGRYSLLIALPLFIVAAAAIGLLDRVEVRDRRNPDYCRACRYDLTGTLAAGGSRCPECGCEVRRTL